ncbi:MAG: protein phosphatase CheZ [Nitrospiria bacterium]
MESKEVSQAVMSSENHPGRKAYLKKKNEPAELYKALGHLAKNLNEMLMKKETIESNVATTAEDLPFITGQLSDLTRFTEEATHRILEHTELVLNNHDELISKMKILNTALKPVDSAERDLKAITFSVEQIILGNKKTLMDILTGLSFQDLASQRVKRMETILTEVQARIIDLVVTFGIQPQQGEEGTVRRQSLLKGLESSTGTKLEQGEVNDLLKELGF